MAQVSEIYNYDLEKTFGIRHPMGEFSLPGFHPDMKIEGVPAGDPNYLWTPETLFPMCNLMVNPRAPLMLKGERGSGKTQAFVNMCAALNLPLYLLAHNEDTLATEPIYTVDIVDGETVTIDGLLVMAYTRGGIFLADEITRARAGMLVSYNSVADKNSILHDRYGNVLKRHPLFRFGATSNSGFIGGSSGIYAGAKRADASTDDRFRVAEVPYPSSETETKVLLTAFPELKDQFVWIKNLVKLANALRASYVAREFPVPISTRTLVSICEDVLLHSSERFAIEWNITNKLSADEYKLTVNTLFRDVFGRELVDAEDDSNDNKLPRS